MVQYRAPIQGDHNRACQLKVFDDIKGGIKGLMDAGLTEVPQIFMNPTGRQVQARGQEPIRDPDS